MNNGNGDDLVHHLFKLKLNLIKLILLSLYLNLRVRPLSVEQSPLLSIFCDLLDILIGRDPDFLLEFLYIT